jgi:hypothetical protein
MPNNPRNFPRSWIYGREALAGVLRDRLAEKQLLLVLDEASSSEQLLSLLPEWRSRHLAVPLPETLSGAVCGHHEEVPAGLPTSRDRCRAVDLVGGTRRRAR